MTDFAQRRTMMVDTQVRPNDVTSYPVIDAMLAVPREEYVPDTRREVAYADGNIDLGAGRVLLEPRTLGKMIDTLVLQSTDLVLDIGCGYGYAPAVMARIAQAVVAVEEDNGLATEAEQRLAAHEVFSAAVVNGALADGCAAQGPYDAVLIEGAIETFPQSLTDQIREGGRAIAIFSEKNLGVVRIGLKADGRMNWRFAFNASAPLLPGFAAERSFVL